MNSQETDAVSTSIARPPSRTLSRQIPTILPDSYPLSSNACFPCAIRFQLLQIDAPMSWDKVGRHINSSETINNSPPDVGSGPYRRATHDSARGAVAHLGHIVQWHYRGGRSQKQADDRVIAFLIDHSLVYRHARADWDMMW